MGNVHTSTNNKDSSVRRHSVDNIHI